MAFENNFFESSQELADGITDQSHLSLDGNEHSQLGDNLWALPIPSNGAAGLSLRTVGSAPIQQAAAKRRRKDGIYQCPYCNSTFTEVHDLQFHINAHLGLKPFKCSMCMFATAYGPTILRKHMKRHNLEVQERQSSDESARQQLSPDPSPSSHIHGMYTTATPPLPSQRQESQPPAPSALDLNEPVAITYQSTPSQYWAPPDTGVSVGYMPPPESPPHTGQVERGPQRLKSSSHRHEMYTTAPPPLPPQRRKSPAPAPSALNLNEPAASTYDPLQRQSTPTPSQYWATGVSVKQHQSPDESVTPDESVKQHPSLDGSVKRHQSSCKGTASEYNTDESVFCSCTLYILMLVLFVHLYI